MTKPARRQLEASVSIRDAKANLSSLARQAKTGVRVVITNHGAPIADLVPHGASSSRVAFLKRPGPLPKVIRLVGKGHTASELVLMDREG